MSQIDDMAQLALKLKDSDSPEVKELAQGYLELEAAYGELKQRYVRQSTEIVMRRNESLLKKLVKHDISHPERDVTNSESSGGEKSE